MYLEPRTLGPELSPDELNLLISSIKERNLTGKHLEIGAAAGGTLKELMLCYPDELRPQFVSIDPMKYFVNQLAVIKENLKSSGLDPDTVDFRVSRSLDALKSATSIGERFSFIFVDGSHKISHVTEDIGWSSLLDPGGLICFHDYSDMHCGVVAAVDRFHRRCPEYRLAAQVDSLLVFEKTRIPARREVTKTDRLRAHAIALFVQVSRSLGKRARVKLSA